MSQTTPMQFITVAQLKERLGATAISLVKSPKTGKLFGCTDNGRNIKCEQSLDTTKEIKYFFQDEDTFDQGCIINVAVVNPPIAVL